MARTHQPVFVGLFRPLLHYPPIRHRHTDYRAHHLSPFQCAIGVAVTAAARCILADARHQAALKAGAKAITSEKETGKIVQRHWLAEHQMHPPPNKEKLKPWERERTPPWYWHLLNKASGAKRTNKRSAMQHAGRRGYARRKSKLASCPLPDFVTIELSRYALLRRANLDPDGKNRRILPAALNRLGRPIGVKGKYVPPLLYEWEELPSGRLTLVVSTAWMQPPFGKVPLPLPTCRSPAAIALYLLLFTLNTRSVQQSSMALISLCERLGIPIKGGTAAMARAVSRALELVNAHLGKLNAGALEAQGIKLPASFDIDDKDGRVRFERIERQVSDYEDDEFVLAEVDAEE